MTPDQALDYVTQLAERLAETRPYLMAQCSGRWQGPAIRLDAPSGLWWKAGPMAVCASPWDTGPDGLPQDQWLHVSVSTPSRCPSYEELTEVRDRLFRVDDTVVHVWPPRSEHFSLHRYCLHLWTPMDGRRPLPDLRGQMGGV